MLETEIELEDVESPSKPVPFQLQFDKPIPSHAKLAEWNPEKDLLAIVTEDSKVLLHRFNWQRLWTINPGKCITSLCWRPDGKAVALGLEDGTIAMHDVENGKLLRKTKSHDASVTCLNWEEDAGLVKDKSYKYEDRTGRFFPPSPRIPQMPGLVSGDSSITDSSEDIFQGLSDSPHQKFNVLCSGDKDGCICFSIFGIFPIAKINIQNFAFSTPFADSQITYQLSNASINKVALSKDLCQLIILGCGELSNERLEAKEKSVILHDLVQMKNASSSDNFLDGLHCFNLNTSIFHNRKNELHQVAQQASSIEELLEVIRASLSIMSKHWSSAMKLYHDKFDLLASLIADHGYDSNPQDEFLTLLFDGRTSPALNQFLVNSVGESGLKRVSKAIDSAGKEIHLVVREHLQPALEIIGFRIGELRGFSRWRARFEIIGLNEKLIDNATEKAGMFIVQVERFLRVLAIVVTQFHNFFDWLLRCTRILLSELPDQIRPANSELVVIFLKFLLDNDPVGQLLEIHEQNQNIAVDLGTMHRVKELVAFGGFADTEFLERNLVKEFNQLEECFKEAFSMPFSTVSKRINCVDFFPIAPSTPSPSPSSVDIPTSVSYYKSDTSQHKLEDYICFTIPDDSFDMVNYICIVKSFAYTSYSLEAVLLRIPDGYHCVDMSLYKDTQLCLLLNETSVSVDDSGSSLMAMIQINDLSFTSVSRQACANPWSLYESKDLATDLNLDCAKVRPIPHSVSKPLAVSASRGVACVFSSQLHALVYILEEDEDEASDTEEPQAMI